MCIRKNQGMCSVEFRNTDENGEEYAFDINNVDLGKLSTINTFNLAMRYICIYYVGCQYFSKHRSY